MTALAINALSTVNSLGLGLEATAQGLLQNRSALRRCDYDDARLDTFIGRIDAVEGAPVRDDLSVFDCRNNRVAQMALRADGFADAVAAAIGRHGAGRIATVLGTSTSGVREGEMAFARRDAETGALPADFRFAETHDHHSLATFVQTYLGLSGPAATVSTACSSSAKVFADAAQLIQAGVCDAAVVGGVDTLCLLTLYGFNSLDLLDTVPSRPNDIDRSGISIGEAGGFALLERDDTANGETIALVLGYGESADAYHMSAPHPDGLGAEMAMRAALDRAGVAPAQVDYINLHGTGSRQNDQAEAAAVVRLFGEGQRCGSTKGATGHTLGAAGILEIAICCLAMRNSFIPGNANLRHLDPDVRTRIEPEAETGAVRYALNNSFGFGGSNCSILLGAPA
jgi:3-oxoacyl-[acyl-carrier-protein] synthase-1